MVTLGMSAHTDRMIKLLVENGVTNTAVLERLLVHGIPRVSLLYPSLSCDTSCLLTSFSLQAQRYESNTSTTSALSTLSHLILIELCWCLPVFCRVLLMFVPFWKGFFSIQHPQHPPSKAGLIMAKKKRGLNGDRCMELNLPWVLVEAAQKRWTSEKMNLGHLDTKSWVHTEVDGSLKNVSSSFVRDSVLGECILLDWQCVYFDLDSSIYRYIVCLACHLKWNQHLCIDILYIWKFILCTHCIYIESHQVILPFWKLLPVDGFKPTMHAVQQIGGLTFPSRKCISLGSIRNSWVITSCNKERYSHLLKQSAMWWYMSAHLWPFLGPTEDKTEVVL